jgi:hypothetical protein
MVVSSNYNLIPYPDHHYPIQPYISEKAMAHQHSGHESVERHDRFQRPRAEIKVGAIHFDIPDSGYDISRCLHYCNEDQLGHLLDIYA